MPISDARLLELAISGLEAQRAGIDEEIAQLRKRAGIPGPFRAAKPGKAAKKGRRKMSAAEKKAVSERMKKMWAARRKAQR
jgi:hypothetical protein